MVKIRSSPPRLPAQQKKYYIDTKYIPKDCDNIVVQQEKQIVM